MPNAKPMFLAVADALKICAGIKKSADKLHKAIQMAAASAIYHSNFHKNADVGIRLVEAIMDTKGVRKNAVVAYLELHGNFQWDKDAKAIKYHRNLEAECKDEEKLALTLAQNPWDQAKPEAAITSEYDLDEDVDRIIKRIKKAVKEGKAIATANVGIPALLLAAAGAATKTEPAAAQ